MDVTQCIADIDVVTHFDAIKNATVAATIAGTKAAVLQQVTTVTIPDVIKTVTHSYGGPGILLGTTWPIVVATLPIVVWRLITNGSIRSWFLFIAVLFNLADCANVTWARSTPRAELDVNTHFKMAIAFSQLKMAFLASAGAWRFGQVYVKRSTKYGVIWSITVYSERFLMMWATAEVIMGCLSVNKHGRVTQTYWAMCVGIPTVYIIAGAMTFTRTLAKLENDFKSICKPSRHSSADRNMFTYLRISNNIAMVATTVCAISVLIVPQVWDCE